MVLGGVGAGEPQAQVRPLNLGGYHPPSTRPKQTVTGRVRISGGGFVRVAGRKASEGSSQEEVAMFLMMSN
jgi:hypothetical protein